MINAAAKKSHTFESRVKGMIAGAAPPRAVIEGADLLGIDLTHVYGLTEVYGPAAVCAQHFVSARKIIVGLLETITSLDNCG